MDNVVMGYVAGLGLVACCMAIFVIMAFKRDYLPKTARLVIGAICIIATVWGALGAGIYWPNGMAGWPTRDKIPENTVIYDVIVQYPNRETGEGGALYFIGFPNIPIIEKKRQILAKDEKTNIVQQVEATYYAFGKAPKQMVPRVYTRPWSKERAEEIEAIKKKARESGAKGSGSVYFHSEGRIKLLKLRDLLEKQDPQDGPEAEVEAQTQATDTRTLEAPIDGSTQEGQPGEIH